MKVYVARLSKDIGRSAEVGSLAVLGPFFKEKLKGPNPTTGYPQFRGRVFVSQSNNKYQMKPIKNKAIKRT